jgi:hypothetical protein
MLYHVTIINHVMESYTFQSRQEAIDFVSIMQLSLSLPNRLEVLDERTIYIQ